MRDPRLAEMELLAALEAGEPPDTFRRPHPPPSEERRPFGMSPKEYTNMFVHLAWHGYVGDLAEFSYAGDFQRTWPKGGPMLGVSPDIEDTRQDRRIALLEKFLGHQPPHTSISHLGRLRLWELRDQLESARDTEPLTGL